MIIENEKELLAAIIQGNQNAEKEFIDSYYRKIKLIVDVRMRNREDKQEIVNDILVAAIIKIRERKYIYDENSSLTKYVHGIAKNIINQYYRDYYHRTEKEDQVEQMISDKHNLMDYGKLYYEEQEEIENRKKMWARSISKLKLKYRKVIYLRYFENLSIGKISELMEITPQMVSDYLKYSKQLLMKDLKRRKL